MNQSVTSRLAIPQATGADPASLRCAFVDAPAMRYLASHSLLHSLFRAGLPWVLVAVLMLGNLILSQTSAVLH
jgi:hypothetical protein